MLFHNQITNILFLLQFADNISISVAEKTFIITNKGLQQYLDKLSSVRFG